MKYLFYILIFILSSCSSDTILNNQSQIDKIDSLKFSEIVYEVSINQYEKFIDTILIEKNKFDKKGILLYTLSEIKREYGKKVVENYYRDNKDLFIQRTSSEKLDIYSEYTTFVSEEYVIKRAEMNANDGFNIIMDYEYDYGLFGNKKSLTIHSKIDTLYLVNFTRYNSNEDLEFSYSILNNDTVEKSYRTYKNKKLLETKYHYINRGITIISDYDENEINYSTKTIELIDGENKLTQQTLFTNDSLGNLISKERIDFINDTTYISKYITVKIYNNNN